MDDQFLAEQAALGTPIPMDAYDLQALDGFLQAYYGKTFGHAGLTRNQVGGSHYQLAIQPVDYIHANKLTFLEGNVVKYVTRHRKKNGAEDVKKAIHYLQMILEKEYGVNNA